MKMELDAAVVDRVRNGLALTEADLLTLDAVDVLSLGMLADEVRRARVGDIVSYTRVLEADVAGSLDDAALGTADEVRFRALAATLEQTIDGIARVRGRLGDSRRLTGFSLADLAATRWGAVPDVLDALKRAGLDAIAEAPVDIVSAADVAAVVASGLGPRTLSVERWPGDQRVTLLQRARDVVAANPTLDRFSPLSRQQSVAAPTTGYHDVRLVALARLALPSVDVIEVDWQQYGSKLAQVALMFGANHLERVSPVDDLALGPRRAAIEEVRRNITAAGFRPAEPGEAP
jgi:2-iminoacetate synthase ThiH